MAVYDKYYPNYKKLYPGVELTPEVLACLRTTDRKMKYAEFDLKVEQYIPDPETGEFRRVPSREDSYERLLEEERQFTQDGLSPEAIVLQTDELRRLNLCLALLSNHEQRLIRALYFDGFSERQLSAAIGVPQKTINDRRRKTLAKLKKMMDK